MRPLLLAAVAALAVLLTAAPPARADESAQETIGRLESEGYTVNVDRVGSAPLDQCVVTSVRNPQTVTRLIRVDNGRNGKHDYDYIEVVVSRSISVSLDCTANQQHGP
ncbi:hypothetical protein SBI67_00335 [Mycolicibacterium sp. 120266]|uniref:hypothetical protein n=1 Tax=Mycolicibacterium sp. 120266 TaxID=3090601 RepID=UPI00299EAA6E|nr:hypothetical protein [Mycolicibacterium sp. 120266]MDX1870556.1 hypothetical protein [Mycolicibacterium sp. 120266]